MSLKTMIVMSTEKDGKTFTFHVEAGSSFGSAYDAAYDILQQIADMAKKAATNVEQYADLETKPTQ